MFYKCPYPGGNFKRQSPTNPHPLPRWGLTMTGALATSQILLFVRDGVCNNEYEFCVLEYHKDVIRNFSANRVSGADFKELLPVIGDRVA